MIARDRQYILDARDEWIINRGKTRDSQRQKLYDAENRVRKMHDMSFETGCGFDTLEEIVEFLEKILKSRWWKSYITPHSVRNFNGEAQVIVTRTINSAWAKHTNCNGMVYIELPKKKSGEDNWAWNKIVILHELAHYPSNGAGIPSHGWLFASVFMALVQRFMDKEVYEDLKSAFADYNVRWRRPRQLSDETKKVLSERMTAMAAAKWEGHVKAPVAEKVDYVTLTDNQTWIMVHLMDDFEADEDVKDYHLDVNEPERVGRGRTSRLPVTKMSIKDVAVRTSCCYDNRNRLSMVGLLKKMKRHSYQEFMEVVDECDAFRYLPYSLSNEY